jgi:uncharacterized protein (DUF736 family)
MPYDLGAAACPGNRRDSGIFPGAGAPPRGAKIPEPASALLRFAPDGFRSGPRRPCGPASTGTRCPSKSAGNANEQETTMANALGYVSETKTGFSGSLAMMNLTAPIRIEKNADKKVASQPDYRVFAGEIETEIGGGWLVKAKSSDKEYISLTLADPQIGPRKIYANLAPVKGKKGRFVLLWNPKE